MTPPTPRRRPEVLAPAGDDAALRAAVLAGADAVYFGLSGFNARARAKNFDEAALSQMEPSSAAADPYAAFHEAVARATKESYEKGPLARFTGVPEDVAKVIQKAIEADRPKARYTVSGSAKILLTQRKLLSG